MATPPPQPRSSPLFRAYIAASADGYIATPDGGVAWLDEFNSPDFGYEAFVRTIGTVVMGRATYDQVLGFGVPWPYANQRAVVLTSRPLGTAPPGVEAHAGDPAPLAESLRAAGGKDVWVVGGAKTLRAFLDAGAVDRLELFVIPTLLGRGVPLFTPSDRRHRLRLKGTRAYANGVVGLEYLAEITG